MSSNDILSDVLEKSSSKKSDDRTKDKSSGKKSAGKGKEVGEENSSFATTSKSSEVSKKTRNEDRTDLGEILLNGFKTMKDSIETMGTNIAQKISEEMKTNFESSQFEEDWYEDVSDNEDLGESDNILDAISKEMATAERSGPNVPDNLAKLVNSLLGEKTSESSMKIREEKYLRPNNISFVETPKVNRMVWDTMTGASRSTDTQVQIIQREFLKSATPITKVIEKLYEARETPDSLDVNDLIATLADSLAYLGSANLQAVKQRRDVIRKDLPDKLQGICNPDMEFTGALLFGDNLQSRIKDVSETTRLANVLKRPTASGSGFLRGRFRGRFHGGSRGSRIMGRGRISRGTRYNPYSKNLNGRRPWTNRS